MDKNTKAIGKKPRNKTGKKDDDQDWKPNSGSEAEIPDVKGEDVELFKPNKNLQNTSRFLARLEQPIPLTEEEIQEFGRQLNKHLENTKNPGHFTIGDHTWETPASRFVNVKIRAILKNCIALLKKTNTETLQALLKRLHIMIERSISILLLIIWSSWRKYTLIVFIQPTSMDPRRKTRLTPTCVRAMWTC